MTIAVSPDDAAGRAVSKSGQIPLLAERFTANLNLPMPSDPHALLQELPCRRPDPAAGHVVATAAGPPRPAPNRHP